MIGEGGSAEKEEVGVKAMSELVCGVKRTEVQVALESMKAIGVYMGGKEVGG